MSHCAHRGSVFHARRCLCWTSMTNVGLFQPRETWRTAMSITASLIPPQHLQSTSPQKGKEKKKNLTEKTSPAGNRMHMVQRRMTVWIQEMERGEEAEILDRSCVLKNACFQAQGDILFIFLETTKKQKWHRGCGGVRRAISFSAITSPWLRYGQNPSAGDTDVPVLLITQWLCHLKEKIT